MRFKSVQTPANRSHGLGHGERTFQLCNQAIMQFYKFNYSDIERFIWSHNQVKKPEFKFITGFRFQTSLTVTTSSHLFLRPNRLSIFKVRPILKSYGSDGYTDHCTCLEPVHANKAKKILNIISILENHNFFLPIFSI